MIISSSASVTGINTLLSKKFAWKINDLSTENLLDPVLNYTEKFRAAKLYEKALSKQNKCCLNRDFDLKGGWRGTPICILVNILIFQKIICRSDTITAFKFVTK